MEVKTTQFSEITISREELDAVVASFIQAQMPHQTVADITYLKNANGDDIDGVLVKTEPTTK